MYLLQAISGDSYFYTHNAISAYYEERYQTRKRGSGDDFMEQTVRAAGAPNSNKPPVESCQGGIFVPVQKNSETLPPGEALEIGTAFPCLISPWEKGEEWYG
jgi:hypothetical protein